MDHAVKGSFEVTSEWVRSPEVTSNNVQLFNHLSASMNAALRVLPSNVCCVVKDGLQFERMCFNPSIRQTSERTTELYLSTSVLPAQIPN